MILYFFLLLLINQFIIIISGLRSTLIGGGMTTDSSQRNQNAIVSIRKSSGRISSASSYDIISPFGEIESGGSELNLTSFDLNQMGTNINAIFSTEKAFLALRSNNTIYTWGHKLYGGVIPSVIKLQLLSKTVTQVYSTATAFTVKTDQGNIITWGDLKLPILAYKDHTYVMYNETWLYQKYKNNTDHTDHSGFYVEKIYTNRFAFAAVTYEGQLATWGDEILGGNSSLVSTLDGRLFTLNDLEQANFKIELVAGCVNGGFSALLTYGRDANIVTWGSDYILEPSTSTIYDLKRNSFVSLSATESSFAALSDTGLVIAWGTEATGGDAADVFDFIKDSVIRIYANYFAFAVARLTDSTNAIRDKEYLKPLTISYTGILPLVPVTIIAWGNSLWGGTIPPEITTNLSEIVVQDIFSTRYAFCVLRNDHVAIVWGAEDRGGTINSDTSETYPYDSYNQTSWEMNKESVVWRNNYMVSGVKQIIPNHYSFAAIHYDGSVSVWGDNLRGGNASSVNGTCGDMTLVRSHQFLNRTYISTNCPIVKIVPSLMTFTAITIHGDLIVWGQNLFLGIDMSHYFLADYDYLNLLAQSKNFSKWEDAMDHKRGFEIPIKYANWSTMMGNTDRVRVKYNIDSTSNIPDIINEDILPLIYSNGYTGTVSHLQATSMPSSAPSAQPTTVPTITPVPPTLWEQFWNYMNPEMKIIFVCFVGLLFIVFLHLFYKNSGRLYRYIVSLRRKAASNQQITQLINSRTGAGVDSKRDISIDNEQTFFMEGETLVISEKITRIPEHVMRQVRPEFLQGQTSNKDVIDGSAESATIHARHLLGQKTNPHIKHKHHKSSAVSPMKNNDAEDVGGKPEDSMSLPIYQQLSLPDEN